MGCELSKLQAGVPQPPPIQRPRPRDPVLLGSGVMPESAMGHFHQFKSRAQQRAPHAAAGGGHRGGPLDDKSTVIWRADGGTEGSSLTLGPAGQVPQRPMTTALALLAPPPPQAAAAGRGQRQGTPATTSRQPPPRPPQHDANSGSCSYVSEDTSTSSGSAARQAGVGNFPNRMAPLDLAPTNFRASDFDFDTRTVGGSRHVSQWSLRIDKLGFAARRFLREHLGERETVIKGYISEVHSITHSQEQLETLGIVREASLCAFSYPVVMQRELQVSHKDMKVSDITLLVCGGVMYFDADMVLQDVRALTPAENGPLRFSPPRAWRPEWTLASGAGRWKPVTLPVLRGLGVRYFTWLLPGELVPGQTETLSRNGGFAYLFHSPTETAVLQAQLDVYFDLVDGDDDLAGAASAGASQPGHPCPNCSRPLVWSTYNQGVYANGWDCENSHVCGLRDASSGLHRWFCQDCSFDICDACHAGLPCDSH